MKSTGYLTLLKIYYFVFIISYCRRVASVCVAHLDTTRVGIITIKYC